MRVSHSTQFLVIMQFRKLTHFLWYSLNTLNGVLVACIEKKCQKIYYVRKGFSMNINSAVICGDIIKLTEHMAIPNRVRAPGDCLSDHFI